MPTRVLIADDRAEIREVLSALVASEPALELVGVAEDTDRAIALAEQHRPDVALIDFKMPGGGGPRAAREIGRCSPKTRVVALSAYEDRGSVFEMLRAGAVGYLVKGASASEIREAIERMARGQAVLSPELMDPVVSYARQQSVQESAVEQVERARVALVRRALAPGALSAVFQPIVELESGRPVGYEALARFAIEPVRSPPEWFAEAEAVGLRTDLELAAVRAALEHLDRLPDGAFISVNVSPRVLLSPSMLETLGYVPPDRLVVETTEHAEVEDYDALRRALLELRRHGARLAVDDAGAGINSLQHVRQVAPDMIKIDVSLIRGIENDSWAQAITDAFVALGRRKDMLVIAEGIESKRIVYVLQALGVRYGQGYYVGRPGPLPAWP